MLKPLNDFVVLQVLKEEETSSGIILPDTSKKPNKAKVIDISDGIIERTEIVSSTGNTKTKVTSVPIKVKKNDIVYFSEYAGVKVKDNNEEYVIVHIKDIFAIVK